MTEKTVAESLGERWTLPSDHLPISFNLDIIGHQELKIISWNALNTLFLNRLYREGLNGSTMQKENHRNEINDRITIREHRILEIIKKWTKIYDVIMIQEIGNALFEQLCLFIASSDFGMSCSKNKGSTDRGVIIFSKRQFEDLEEGIEFHFNGDKASSSIYQTYYLLSKPLILRAGKLKIVFLCSFLPPAIYPKYQVTKFLTKIARNETNNIILCLGDMHSSFEDFISVVFMPLRVFGQDRLYYPKNLTYISPDYKTHVDSEKKLCVTDFGLLIEPRYKLAGIDSETPNEVIDLMKCLDLKIQAEFTKKLTIQRS